MHTFFTGSGSFNSGGSLVIALSDRLIVLFPLLRSTSVFADFDVFSEFITYSLFYFFSFQLDSLLTPITFHHHFQWIRLKVSTFSLLEPNRTVLD
jgi:hypothetical protein